MKKINILLVAALSFTAAFGQTLYAPGGTVGNNSTNSNVGIGTGSTTPAFKLDIKGGDIFLNNGINSSLHFRTDGNGNAFINNMNNFVNNGSSGNGYLTITGQSMLRFKVGNSGTSGTEWMRITEAGRVGIGTANPNANLDVFGTDGIRLTNSTVGEDYMLIKANHNVAALNPGASTVSALITNRRLGHLVFDIYANDNGDSFAIRTDKDLNGEVDEISMVVKPTGNVGIGTTTPSTRLDVSGVTTVRNEGDGAILLDLKSERGWRFQQKGTGPSASLEFYNYGGLNKNFSILTDGKVGIGTPTPDAKLTVKGDIHTQEVKVDLNGAVAPDYVFEKDYPLTTLEDLKSYIDQHKHLPEVPSAKEMEENGINLKEMNLLLLKKVEELTLHVIEQNKLIKNQNDRISKLENTNR
jgi:hypothetical protein